MPYEMIQLPYSLLLHAFLSEGILAKSGTYNTRCEWVCVYQLARCVGTQ